MIKKENIRLLLAIFLIAIVMDAQIITTSNYVDLYEGGTPANPASGIQRLWASSGTHLVNCKLSSGASCQPSSGGGVPSGLVAMTLAAACPSGYTESAALSGATLYGTVAANGDVGTTGGSDSITPTGSNGTVAFTPTGSVAAPTFTGSSANTSADSAGTPAGTNSTATGPAQTITWPAGVPTLSGTTINAFSSVINHTHTVTVIYNAQGGTTAATAGTHSMTSNATGGSVRALTSGDVVSATTANPSGGVASITPTINAPGTIAWPVGVPTNATSTIPAQTFTGSALGTHLHTLTATGTNSAPAFTGNSGTVLAETWTGTGFDNRSAFVRVIFCTKT